MKHNITPSAQGTIRAWARIDYPHLSNMIAELADNSLDAQKPSQSNLKVEVIVEKNDPASTHIDTVVVTDNGTGVKCLPSLFRFGSSTKNMVNTIGGFGAGLKQAGAAMTNGQGALVVITRRDDEEWYGRFEYASDLWQCEVFQITDVTAHKAQIELFKKYLPKKTHKTGTAVIISGVDTRGETNTKSGGYYYRQLQADLLLTYNQYLYKNAGVTIKCGEYELSKKKTMTGASSSCDYDLLHLDPLKTNFLCGGPDFKFQPLSVSVADGTKRKKLWVRASHTPGQRTDQASCPFKKASSYGSTSGAYQNTVSFLTKTGRRIYVDHTLAKKVFRNLNYLSQFHIEIMFEDPIESTDSLIVTDASKTGVKVVSAAKTALKNLLQHHIDRLAERQKSSKATTTKSEQKSLDAACSSAGLSYEDRFSPTHNKVEVLKQKRRSGTGNSSGSGSSSGAGNGGTTQTTGVNLPRRQSQTGAVTPSSSWSASFSKFKRREKNRQFKVIQPADGKYDVEMNTLYPSYVAAKNLPDWNNGGCDHYILDTLAVAMTELDYNIHYETSADYFDFTECLDGYKKLLYKNTVRMLEEEEAHLQALAS